MVEGLTVTIGRDVRVEMPDGSVVYGIGVQIAAPSPTSESGWKFVSFMVERLDDFDERYVDAAAYSFAQIEASDVWDWQWKLLRHDYADAITAAVAKAVAQHAA